MMHSSLLTSLAIPKLSVFRLVQGFLITVGLLALAGARTTASTVLGIDGTRFHVNGQPTFLLGFSYYGALGASEEFIRRDLEEAQDHGFNWLRVWATWAAFDGDVSAVDANGSPREPFLAKLKWLVAECDRRGIVVDITLTRGKGSAVVPTGGHVRDFSSHQRAVETLVNALKPHRNWYLDLANERDVRDARYVPAAELKPLRELVRRLDPSRLVTASFGGHDLSEEDVREALLTIGLDFLSPHRPRTAESPAQTETKTRACLAMMNQIGRAVPVHHQEPFRRGYESWEPTAEDFLTDLRGAITGGAAGWCFHNGSQRKAPGSEPRRSFDLRAKRLFDQLDPEELKLVRGAAACLDPQPNARSGKHASPPSQALEWVRSGVSTNAPVWGMRDGLLWGLPTGKSPRDGPRGLIRLWFPVLTNGAYDLINFIAIEPVVAGRKGYSELERSAVEGVSGKSLWAVNHVAPAQTGTNLYPGQLTRLASGAESLTIRVEVERFENGAHVALTVTQSAKAPDEIELAIHAEPDSAPMEYCLLTATMGNKARTRLLWLKDEVVSSLKLYPDYQDVHFAPHRSFPLSRLHQTANGDLLAAIITDEENPSTVEPFPGTRHWRYRGFPVTQYWRKPAGAQRDDLHVTVNARYTYWLSRQPIPGGIAFENFEMRERFYEGQRFVFGITRKSPGQLGFTLSH